MFVEFLMRGADSEGMFESGLEGLRVLDLCAAPGGKTTLYSTLAGVSGLVVANEVIRPRASVLAENVRRWGVGNVAVTCNEVRALGEWRHFFDVVAVDAPCSGEGMFRKNPESRSEWSAAGVEMCAARQRKILAEVWDALRPGGLLIYSTCTFNRRENEENVAWLIENFAAEALRFPVDPTWGVEANELGYRFLPGKIRGEGFFAAALRKVEGRRRVEIPRARREPLVDLSRADSRPLAEFVEAPDAMRFGRVGDSAYGFYRPVYHDVKALAGSLNVIYSGVEMGQIFGGKLRPDHSLALFAGLRRDFSEANSASDSGMRSARAERNSAPFSVADLSLDEALNYLRKREFGNVDRLNEGLNLLQFNGLPIGWTKRIGHRTNSLLPNSMRIINL